MVRAVMVTGVLPAREKNVSMVAQHMRKGALEQLKPRHFHVVMGDTLARHLGLSIGDEVMIITPQATASPVGILPRFKRFHLAGTFHVDSGFGYNSQVALIHLKDAQSLFNAPSNTQGAVSGLRLRVDNLYGAPALAKQLAHTLKGHYRIADWTQQYGEFFKAIRMEKTMMFLILLLIIAVAAFNLVSSLVMVVTDKRSDIAILRTMGVSPSGILRIFVIQGGLIGLLGSTLGIIGGITLSLHVTELVNLIQRWFGVQFLSSAVYYVNFLPSRLLWSDVWHVGLLALGLSLLATWYPAWKAAGIQPAEALRYE
jgi:lipoprotein-releasing system permease protein